MDAAEEARRREAIKQFFRDPSKVDKMSAGQVTAIYLRLKAQGKVS